MTKEKLKFECPKCGKVYIRKGCMLNHRIIFDFKGKHNYKLFGDDIMKQTTVLEYVKDIAKQHELAK